MRIYLLSQMRSPHPVLMRERPFSRIVLGLAGRRAPLWVQSQER
ncbi:hypothetical protein [Rhodocaloribacter litoris]|nr:hypothetical protein [Rhodocaloribacter litoris]